MSSKLKSSARSQAPRARLPVGQRTCWHEGLLCVRLLIHGIESPSEILLPSQYSTQRGFLQYQASQLRGYPDTVLFWDLSIRKDFSYNMLWGMGWKPAKSDWNSWMRVQTQKCAWFPSYHSFWRAGTVFKLSLANMDGRVLHTACPHKYLDAHRDVLDISQLRASALQLGSCSTEQFWQEY